VTVNEREIPEGKYYYALFYLSQARNKMSVNDVNAGHSVSLAFTALHDLATGKKVLVDKLDAEILTEYRKIENDTGPIRFASEKAIEAIEKEQYEKGIGDRRRLYEHGRTETLSEVRRIVGEMKGGAIVSINPGANDVGTPRQAWDIDTLSWLSRRLDELEGGRR